MKNNPPMGVIGPKTPTDSNPKIFFRDIKYNDPLKSRMPKVKQ